MALYDTPIYIVPCGLNYFQGHRFRGSVLVQFGRPYLIPKSLVELYNQKDQRRRACNMLLQIVKSNLETVITTAPNHEHLQNIKLTRKLYQPSGLVLTSEQYLELHHRFLLGFQTMKDHPLLLQYLVDINAYRADLKALGLDDKHLEESSPLSNFQLFGIILLRLIVVLTTLCLALPGGLLNLPVALTARYVAVKHAKSALKDSEVKIEAKDVLASKKVIVAICFFPALYAFYTFLTYWYWGLKMAVCFSIAFPIVSVASILVAEEGISIAISLLVMLQLGRYAEKIEDLRNVRKALQKRIRDAVKQFGANFAGEENLEDWRIIKEDEIERSENAEKMKAQPGIRAKKPKRFSKQQQSKEITDAEWEEMKDVLGS